MESRKDFKKSVVTIGGAIACLLVLLLGIGTALAQTPPLSNTPVEQPPRIPNTPAGQTLNAFLDAFNSGDHARLETYVHT